MMNRFLHILCCFLLLGIISCQKEERQKEEQVVLLTKITTSSGSFTYSYDENGRLKTEQYETEIGSYTKTYTDYNNEGWLTGYTINFASEQETDLRCKNTFDAQGMLIRADQYRLDDGSLTAYTLIEYSAGIVIRKSYDESSSLTTTDEFFLTDDGKNVAKRIFYPGDATAPTSTTTYGGYDDKKNPKTLLPAGYSPWSMDISSNNATSAVWITKSAPPGTEFHYTYTYEYNADGYPLLSTDIGGFSTLTQQYEYSLK